MKSMMGRLKKYLGRKNLELKYGKNQNYEIQERWGKVGEEGLEMERKEDRGSERVHVFRLCVTEEWRTGSACEGESKESGGDNGTDVGYWKEEV